jgi:hypothetical protein
MIAEGSKSAFLFESNRFSPQYSAGERAASIVHLRETDMKKITRLAIFVTILSAPLSALAAPIHAVLYKNPECDCCQEYAAYLQQSGFEIEIKETDDLATISATAGVPADLEGCHTMLVDGYVIDGLVPVDIVKKVLTERPPIVGVTLPGMPTGAPGMEGVKKRPFTVYAFTKDGKAPTVYAVE